MKISIVIAAFNEGKDLEATVALARSSEPAPYEIIVVDDGSDEEVESRIPWSDVRVIKTPGRLGAGPAKRYGGMAATGDIIVLLDAHMRFNQSWLSDIVEAHELFPESIFCPACRDFPVDSKFLGSGAYFNPQMDVKWLNRGPLDTIDRVPAVLGACYVIPKNIWDDLQGFNPCFHGWGMEEQDLSLRSWLYGYEVRRINKLCVLHRFNREMKGHFLNSWEVWYNQMAFAFCVFEDGVFDDIWWPYFRAICPGVSIQFFQDHRTELERFREEVQDRRIYRDFDLDALCGYRLPSPKMQRMAADKILTERSKRARDQWAASVGEPRDNHLAPESLQIDGIHQ